jgi:hypothetical protein
MGWTTVCNILKCLHKQRKYRIYLHINGNVPFPDPHGLVVGGGDEPPILVDEGDGVDRAQVSVVFLNNFVRPGKRF